MDYASEYSTYHAGPDIDDSEQYMTPIDVCEVRIVQLQHWVGRMIIRTEGTPDAASWKSREARLVRALDGLTNRRARRAAEYRMCSVALGAQRNR